MHPLVRILAVAYLVLAAIASLVLVQTAVNYVHVTEVRVNIGSRVAVTGVQILWNQTQGVDPVVKVFATATNPGRIPIEVTNFDFLLHMDDPGDLLPWDDPTALARTVIRPGGYTSPAGRGILIAPGAQVVLEAIVPIQGTDQIDRFDRPDASGKFHPIVWNPLFVYSFVEFDVRETLGLASYYAFEGVVPLG